jgi:hypothetical protein
VQKHKVDSGQWRVLTLHIVVDGCSFSQNEKPRLEPVPVHLGRDGIKQLLRHVHIDISRLGHHYHYLDTLHVADDGHDRLRCKVSASRLLHGGAGKVSAKLFSCKCRTRR